MRTWNRFPSFSAFRFNKAAGGFRGGFVHGGGLGFVVAFGLVWAVSVSWVAAAEYHVSPRGNDAHDGSASRPLKTVSAAAQKAQPGDVVTVHAGVYRERVAPPRGGESDARRIVYRAAPGEEVVLTGAEPVKGWKKVEHDTWKLVLPNAFFGGYHPFAETIHGDWFSPNGRRHHTGAVYLDGHWLTEAATLEETLRPVGKTPLWFARVDGEGPEFLFNMASFRVGEARPVPAERFASRRGTANAPCSEGGQCVGYIRKGDWLCYDRVEFGHKADRVELRVASATEGGEIELRLDSPQGELLGAVSVPNTGGWQNWKTITANIKPTDGPRRLHLVFKPHKADGGSTAIWAQFPGVDPNASRVEVNVRPTVFSPEKPGIHYLTVRGFALRCAATNWAPPTAGQFGLLSAYWCKGWIIEDNDVGYSKCVGIALGKHADAFDNTSADTAEGYVETIRRAYQNGWNKNDIGHHVVRNNRVHHCEQAGIVGSMGCAFSEVCGNEIHDIHVQRLFSGAEMGGIKFHAAVDTKIVGNRIHRVGGVAGIWLDWMAQGTQVVGNLLHDNDTRDLFLEVNHGPTFVADNFFLSPKSILSCSNGVAYVHNFIAGTVTIAPEYGRETPCLEPHDVRMTRLVKTEVGDDRWMNNLLLAGSPAAYDKAKLPVCMEGNVFMKNATPSKHERSPRVMPDSASAFRWKQEADGSVRLEWSGDGARPKDRTCRPVTTERLGKTALIDQRFEQPDGSPLPLGADYFGVPRHATNPSPGPWEISESGRDDRAVRLWPKRPPGGPGSLNRRAEGRGGCERR